MKNLAEIFVSSTLSLLLTGCVLSESIDYTNVFFSNEDVILGVEKEAYCKAIEAKDCSPAYAVSFSYAVDKEGQIYLVNNRKRSIHIFDEDGQLKETIDFENAFEKYRKSDQWHLRSESIFLDPKEAFIYLDLKTSMATDTDSVVLKYSKDTGEISEEDSEEFEKTYLFSYKNPIQLSYKDNFIILHNDGSIETLDATRISENNRLIGADENYVYYLANTFPEDHSLPLLTKANKEFEPLETIEIPGRYKSFSEEENVGVNIFLDDFYLSDSGDIYVSFMDEEKGLWYLQKYSFDSQI